MTISNKTTIKTYFETGDFPTQSNFSDFIDSCIFTAETTAQAVNGDLSIGGIFSVSGKSTLAGIAATIVSATSVFGSFTGNLKAITVSAATVSPNNITGTNTNDNAAAGSVGEYISSSVAIVAAIAATNNQQINVTSISLTAGDWDVQGVVIPVPAGTTTMQAVTGNISLTSATVVGGPNGGGTGQWIGTLTGQAPNITLGTMRVSIATTTTVYLTQQATFGTSTYAAAGFIGARRVR